MKFYVAAILAISFLELFSVHILTGSDGTQIMPLSSCIDLDSTEINIKRISDYEIQHRPIKAVIFITKRGVKVCVPHDLPWVQNNIRKLNGRPKPRKQNRSKTTLKPNTTTS